MIWIIAISAGFLAAFAWEYFCTHILRKTSLIINGWRLHHSIYGLLFFVIGLLFSNTFITSFGVGILIQHTLTDGFRFISKEKNKKFKAR